jgi:glycosyltransferase involved in cell wall biosynthesis
VEAGTGSGTLPVSVLIPVYNQAAMLRRALRSIAAQEPALPTEVIVIDDASSDASSATARQMGATLIRHERNRGTAAARNSGLRIASEPWIALLDSDDEWLPHHLALLWGLRSSHVLVASSAVRRDASGRRTGLAGPARDEPLELHPSYLIFPGNPVPASGALARRDVVEAVGGFRPPDGVEDMDLWIRVLEHGTGVVVPEISVNYHEHDAQASRRIAAMQQKHIAVAERFADRSWWSPTLVERWRARATWNNFRSAIRHGRVGDAVRNAAWVAARPQRIRGALTASSQRRRIRRRAAAGDRGATPRARPG